MSAYDDAVAYLDAEVHPRCDYDIYSDMRKIVDEMEAENAKLRQLCTEMLWSMKGAHGYYKGEVHATLMTRSMHDGKPDPTVEISLSLAEEIYEDRMRELGIEVRV